MVVLLGDREAALPLRALQREFDIPDESEDGRMLALIAASLDFVTSLRLGDALPAEVLSGDASWEPSSQHLRLALRGCSCSLRRGCGSGTGENAVAWSRPATDGGRRRSRHAPGGAGSAPGGRRRN